MAKMQDMKRNEGESVMVNFRLVGDRYAAMRAQAARQARQDRTLAGEVMDVASYFGGYE